MRQTQRRGLVAAQSMTWSFHSLRVFFLPIAYMIKCSVTIIERETKAEELF